VSQSGQDFGANDWLVEEMYERYQSDPTSVPSEWVTYFQNNPQAGSATQTPASATPGAGTPPTPKPVTPPNISMPGVSAPAPVAPAAPVHKFLHQSNKTPVTPSTCAPVVTQLQPAQPVQTQPVVRNVATTPATPADPIAKPIPTLVTPSASKLEPIRGVSARVVQSMEASLTVPTATSVRAIPAKLMIDNRIVINNHLKRGRGGKVSFTHIIAYAMIKALRAMPEMNAFYGELDGKPALGTPDHINLGIAIDLAKPDGSRQLLVPSIKGCEALEFGQFWVAYEEIVKKARAGTLTVEDYAGTTVSLTNPGTIGTVHSVPRLVQNQGLIIGVGAMDYPAEFQGASEETLARMAVSKVITLTSTYDHRVIQGAQSGDFLRRIHELLAWRRWFLR
jgi:multifunctional 2-oxoglutarate metabolism enzyme